MAGALSFLASGWEGFGYYFSHWNSDPFSIGCVIVLALVLSGYFYGCIFRNLVKPLKNIDCTLIGICFILAVFQALVFFLIATAGSTNIAYIAMAVILLLPLPLCLFTWSSVIPAKRHLFSLVLGIAITAVLVHGSMNLNTNNIYFDSITYLSEVVESSRNAVFGRMVFPGGYIRFRMDPLHDYTGYYYFWGILLRWAVNLFDFKGLVTPIYIWGATVLYGMMLGMLAVSSACALYRDKAWKGVIFTVLFMAPFFTNYFNTTLAFFGNTIRTVIIGTALLIVYLILRYTKNARLFLPLMVVYYAALNVSSSSLFLIAMITTGLFFSLTYAGETDWKRWAGFILTLLPLVHMAMAVVMDPDLGYFVPLGVSVAVIAVIILVAWLLRNKLELVNKGFRLLLPAAFVILIVLSFLKRNGDYGYAYFFRSSSLDDMTVNMTSHLSGSELIRNIIFYAAALGMLVNFKFQTKYKLFLLCVIALFINPLVQPAISSFLTAGVYSRVFDLLTNPFTLCFILFSLEHIVKVKPVGLVVTAVLCAVMAKFGYDTLTTPYSKALTVGTEENWNWEAKVTQDSYDVYEYINNAVSTDDFSLTERDKDNRAVILSQDSGLKGYVGGIEMAFTTEDYRAALADQKTNKLSERMITLMYPDRRYTEDDLGDVGDYSKLGDLFIDSKADYVVINNTLAVWDERGWYAKPYDELVNKGMCTKVFENETWAILRMNHDYEPAGKHNDRYWVHKYEEE